MQFDSAGPIPAIPVIDKKWYSFPSINFMMEITVKLKKRGTLNMFNAQTSKETSELKNGSESNPAGGYLQARSLDFASSMNLLGTDPPVSIVPSDDGKVTAVKTIKDSSNANLRKTISMTSSPPPPPPKPIASAGETTGKISLVEKEKLKQLLRERYRVDRLKNSVI